MREGVPDLEAKRAALRKMLRGMGRVLIAFSGGRDSVVLLAEAVRALGAENVRAVTATSLVHSAAEAQTAAQVASALGVQHIRLATDELSLLRFRANTEDRCRLCKVALFERLWQIARDEGIDYVLEGINATESAERPELLKVPPELGVRASLAEVGLTREGVIDIIQAEGLPAPRRKSYCLASRVSRGILIDEELLARIEQAESYLKGLGFTDAIVRVHSDNLARVKVPRSEAERFLREGVAGEASQALRRLGFANVAVDLDGI